MDFCGFAIMMIKSTKGEFDGIFDHFKGFQSGMISHCFVSGTRELKYVFHKYMNYLDCTFWNLLTNVSEYL